MLSSRRKDKLKIIVILMVVFFLSALTGCGYAGNSKLPRQGNDTINEITYSELASEYFVDGMNALRRGDSVIALNLFETAFMLDTASKFLYDKIINTAITSNNPSNAIRAIIRGREFSNIGDEDLRKLFVIFSRYNYLSDAFEALSAVKEKTKQDTIMLARISEQIEKYLYSIELYKTLFPDTSTELQLKIADLYMRAALFSPAESLYLAVISKQPNNSAAKKGLALSLIEQNALIGAKVILKEVLAIDSKDTEAAWSLLVLSTKIGDFETALELAKKLSERFPEKTEYWAIMGTIYNAKNSYDSALVALNKVLELGIRTPMLLFELGMASERTGKFEDAEKYFKETLEMAPNYAVAANYLGYMWAEKGINLDEAEKLLLSALREEPDNGAFLDSYGWILFQQGKYDEAKEHLLRSAKLITDDYVVYYHLGELYLKLGNKKEALNYFIKANTFKGNPDFETIENLIKDLSK